MNPILILFEMIAAVVILTRCVCIASTHSRKTWEGHPLAFIGIATGYPLLVGGAIGMLLGWTASPWLLLFGVAIVILADRRTAQHWSHR